MTLNPTYPAVLDEDGYPHELTTGVSPVYRSDHESTVLIGISAVGGGTVGIAYANNHWRYTVTLDGKPVITGQDLRSGGMGATHQEMTRTLASFLAAAGESLYLSEDSPYAGEYEPDASVFLIGEYDRLSAFADGE